MPYRRCYNCLFSCASETKAPRAVSDGADVTSPEDGRLFLNQKSSACARPFGLLSGLAARSKRTLLASRYFGTRSIAIQRRLRVSATTPVVLEPANGSMTVSPLRSGA